MGFDSKSSPLIQFSGKRVQHFITAGFFAGKTLLLCQAVNWWKHLNLGYWTL